MSQSKRHRYPTTAAEIEHLVETEERFMGRLIRWTLEECARLNKIISMKQLWIMSNLQYHKLSEYRDYIFETVIELGLPVHPHSLLAQGSNELTQMRL